MMTRFLILLTIVLAVPSHALSAERGKSTNTMLFKVTIVDVNSDELNGDEKPADIVAKIAELERKGKLSAISRIQLSAIEDNPSMVQFGKRVPVATGRMSGFSRTDPNRRPTTTYRDESVGTLVKIVARVDGNSILAEFQAEQSRVVTEPAKEDEIPKSSVDTITVETTLRIPQGETVIVGSKKTKTGETSKSTFLLATASIQNKAEPPARREIRIFQLKFAAAKAASEVLKTLLGEKDNIKISVDERSNSVIITGASDDLKVVEALLLKLDAKE